MPSKKIQIYMLRATLVSLSCNVVLVLIKITALAIIGSLAIAVDLGISIVGLMVSIILYYSIKLANKPADLFHNYGYGKVEHVCEAMEGVVLLGIAVAMSSLAFMHLFHPKAVTLPWIGIISCSVNLTINFGGAWYIFKMAKKSHSPAIYAEGLHYRMEGVISAMIGVSFVISTVLLMRGQGNIARYIDPIAALCVSLFLVIPSIKLAKKSFFNLLDSSVEEDSQMEILRHLGGHVNEYCEFKDIKTRVSGRQKFVEFKLVVPEEISFKKGHKTVSKIEKEIREGIPNCEVLIKMEPCDRDCQYILDDKKCPYL